MNILFIESSLDPTRGGVQRVTWVVSNFLKSKGYNIFFAFWFKDSSEVDKCYKIRIGNDGVISKNCVGRLLDFVKINNIDLIIQQGRGKSLVDFLKRIKREKICKIIYCLHLSPNYSDFNYNNSLRSILKNNLCKILYGIDFSSLQEKIHYDLADRYVLLSETFRDDFLQRTKIRDGSKLRWISNPLSFPLLTEEVEKRKYVLIISRMHEQQKNLTTALRIWKELERRGHKDWKLLMGGYGPDEQMILNYAASLGIERMSYVGKVENPIPLYRESSIFMMTSNYEGFGMVLTESLEFDCVPVAFDTFTALHDILTDGYNGYIIPEKDENMYVEKLETLMDNEQILHEMAQNCKDSCKKFTVETIGKQWLKLIDELKNDI